MDLRGSKFVNDLNIFKRLHNIFKLFKLFTFFQIWSTDASMHKFCACFYLDRTFKSNRYFLEKENFFQFIIEPTHIEGNLLDQAYLKDIHRSLEITAETHSKYYTDHRGLAIIIKKRNETG